MQVHITSFKRWVIVSFFAPLILFSTMIETHAFSNQVIQKGATGDDVIELQARLQYIGFYNGKIDGVFGWGTYWAVRNFQEQFGLTVDGLVGAKMKQKLVSATKFDKQYVHKAIEEGRGFTYYGGVAKETQKGGKTSQQAGKGATAEKAMNIPPGYSDNDIRIMAQAVYGEARGEPYVGQVAVAAVIINRVKSPLFPNTVSGVIFEPRAFTAVADGQIWLEPNETARKAVIDALNGYDPSGQAIYYFNPDTATSPWIWTRPQIKQIGQHIFCK